MQKRNSSWFYVLPVVGVMLGTLCPAAFAATASSNATANVVAAIAITNTQGLDFGNLAVGVTGGTVVVSTAGARSATGDVTLSSVDPGNEATFSVTGDPGASYAITLPSSAVTLTSGANSMTVDTFTSNPVGTGTITGGSTTLSVGGTLNVGASQATGAYTGTFDVTVAYN